MVDSLFLTSELPTFESILVLRSLLSFLLKLPMENNPANQAATAKRAYSRGWCWPDWPPA
jgi:hypothetical protein